MIGTGLTGTRGDGRNGRLLVVTRVSTRRTVGHATGVCHRCQADFFKFLSPMT